MPPSDPWTYPTPLAGRHVLLEPLTADHHAELLEVALDPELWRWTVSRIETAEDLRAYLDVALEERRQGRSMPFLVRHQESGRAAGCTRYGNMDRANRRVEIGWTWVGAPFQRTPVNTEAKYLLLRHAFEALGCIRVELKTDALNQRSRRAILRIGAREEGTLRDHQVTASGRVRDTVYFSIVAREWPEVRAALEARLARPPSASAS